MIDSSDDERQLEDLAADGARRQMDAARVHEELASLHGALSSRHRALDAREAQLDEREQQLAAREEQLIADEALLRTLLSKEAARLQQEAKERLDGATNAQLQRLQGAVGALRAHLKQVQTARSAWHGAAPELPSTEPPRRRPLSARPAMAARPAAVATPKAAPAPAPASAPAPTRDLKLKLQQAREGANALVALWGVARWPQLAAWAGASGAELAAAQQRALPAAADALGAGASELPPAQLLCWLRFAWYASAATDAKPASPEWCRRMRTTLSRRAAAAPAAEPAALFGGGAPRAAELVGALLLLRLARRASASGSTAGGEVPDLLHAIGALRHLAAHEDARLELLRLGALPDVHPLVAFGHAAVRLPAAALLLALCADGPSADAAVGALAEPEFFRAAAAALKADGAADGGDGLAARLCVLLQRVSQRPGTRDLFALGGLRGSLVSLLHASPTDFLADNVRSILHNTRTTAGVFAPQDSPAVSVAAASPSVFTPN